MEHATQKPRKTVEDYFALPDDVRAELIDGDLYVTPSPTLAHQRTCLKLAMALEIHAAAHQAGMVFLAPLDVHLPSGDVVQPDVLFVSTANRGILGDWIHGVPDLAVEVVSHRHAERDRLVKRDLYEKNGLSEYWIVDPAERSIEVLRHAGGAFAPGGFFTGQATLVSPLLLPGLSLPLEEVFSEAA